MKKLSALLSALFLLGLVSCASTGASANVETGIINSTCPLQGRDVAAGKVVEYNGYAIGLCCDNCIAGWENMSVDQKDAVLADLLK